MTVQGVQAKGYRREQFADSWARYCDVRPLDDSEASQRHKPNNDVGFGWDGSNCEGSSENVSVPAESPVSTGIGTLGRIEVAREAPEATNDAAELPAKTVAELSDEELLAIFPGATIEPLELEGDVALCGCRSRVREWRLRDEALDATYTRVSNNSYREATGQGRDVLETGKRSGWVYETTPTGRGHQWVCATCHPPAAGLEVEYRELSA